MDTKTAEKISQLARSMKELHLAATMDEAYARAREIILGTPTKDKQKIGEALNEFEQVEKEKKDTAVILEEVKKQKKTSEQAEDLIDAADQPHE